MVPTLSQADVKKLKELIDEGCKIMGDIQALRESLKETVSAVGEELDIDPKLINKAIRTVHKESFKDEKESFDDLDELLNVLQRK